MCFQIIEMQLSELRVFKEKFWVTFLEFVENIKKANMKLHILMQILGELNSFFLEVCHFELT